MGVDLYRLKYKLVYDHLTEEEVRFMEYFPLGETGSCLVDKDTLGMAIVTLLAKANPVPKELVKKLDEEVSRMGSFDVQIF